MKNNMMKKLLTMTLACAMTLSLAACGSKAEPSADQSTAAPIETDTKAYKVAIIKQLDHASLDEIANAVTAELDQISADKNVKIEYEVTSGCLLYTSDLSATVSANSYKITYSET